MPAHQFTTPRVVYLGLAYGEKDDRQAGPTARTAAGGPARPGRERTRMRRVPPRPPATLR